MAKQKQVYPREVANVIRKQSFFIESYLSTPDMNANENPLMTYGKFSRYRFHIISEDRKAAFANIPIANIDAIIRKSKQISDREFMSEKSSETNTKPAYTVKFNAGNDKGKTPAEILLAEGENGVVKLRGQYKFLNQNVQKYPKNRVLMDAIVEAVRLFQNGELSEDAAKAGSTHEYLIYSADMRPLRSMPKNVAGMMFVYGIKIIWNAGLPYPVSVEITNYYAPVDVTDKGTFNVRVKDRDLSSVKKNIMNLTEDEWMWMLHLLEVDMQRFEMVNARKIYNDFETIEKQQKQAFSNKSQQYNNSGNYQNNYYQN